MNLHKLPYPLFKITLTEAAMLIEAKKAFHRGRESVLGEAVKFSCRDIFSAKQIDRLLNKIGFSLGDEYFLDSFQNYSSDWNQRRIIWINKLLKHNGYA